MPPEKLPAKVLLITEVLVLSQTPDVHQPSPVAVTEPAEARDAKRSKVATTPKIFMVVLSLAAGHDSYIFGHVYDQKVFGVSFEYRTASSQRVRLSRLLGLSTVVQISCHSLSISGKSLERKRRCKTL